MRIDASRSLANGGNQTSRILARKRGSSNSIRGKTLSYSIGGSLILAEEAASGAFVLLEEPLSRYLLRLLRITPLG